MKKGIILLSLCFIASMCLGQINITELERVDGLWTKKGKNKPYNGDQALELSRNFKNKEAIKLYDKAIDINPTVAQAYFNRGACKGNNFDFEGAIKDYDKAIAINPQYMEAYGNRGNAKINMYTTKGVLKPTSTQTASACEDFHKAKQLGDNSIGTEDMIYLYCKKNKPKEKK